MINKGFVFLCAAVAQKLLGHSDIALILVRDHTPLHHLSSCSTINLLHLQKRATHSIESAHLAPLSATTGHCEETTGVSSLTSILSYSLT